MQMQFLPWCKRKMAITLNIHTNSHIVGGRPTPTLVERFGNGSVCERSIYERFFTSGPSIKKYQAKPAHVNTTLYLDVIENPVEYQKLLWIILLVFIFVCWQSSFHCIEVHSQPWTHWKVWAMLSALKMIVWLTETNLNTTDFPIYIIYTRWLA